MIHDNVECPSLSPDGTRIGYKKLVGKDGKWRFHVLDLATGADVRWRRCARWTTSSSGWTTEPALPPGRRHLLPADGSGVARRFLAHADSPAVVR